jgi:hypothetical protein
MTMTKMAEPSMTGLNLSYLPRERLEEVTRVTLEALGSIQGIVQKETLQSALIREQEETITELTTRLAHYSRLLSDAAQWRENREEVYRSALMQVQVLVEAKRYAEALNVIGSALDPDTEGEDADESKKDEGEDDGQAPS